MNQNDKGSSSNPDPVRTRLDENLTSEYGQQQHHHHHHQQPPAQPSYPYISSTSRSTSLGSAPTDEDEWRHETEDTYHTTANDDTTAATAATASGHENSQTSSSNNNNDGQQPQSGGRLWRLAGEVAAGKHTQAALRRYPFLADTLLQRIQSRADPDAVIAQPPTGPPRLDHATTTKIMVQMKTDHEDLDEEEAFLMNTGLAHKRVRVIQLLIIGLVGLLLGWLGNFFVSSSCYFSAVPVTVGGSDEVFTLHFGLWNYSPVDSALNGYKYCYPYSGVHRSDAPILGRVVNLAALLAGTYSLVVLWMYLISGKAQGVLWKAAVYAAVAAGLLQLCVPLLFFTGSLCRSGSCSAGPASALSAVTAVAWVILGAELHYHCPVVIDEACAAEADLASIQQHSEGSSKVSTPVAQLEMADLAGASQQYLDRFHNKSLARGRYKPPQFT